MYFQSDDSDDDVYVPGGGDSAMAAKHRLAVYFPLLRRRLLDESKTKIFLRGTRLAVYFPSLRRHLLN